MMGLKEFLVSAKTGVSDLQSRLKIHLVIGNESCDLDSTVSAITYAYFLHQTKHKPGTFYLPVLNILRKQFRLRLETVYFLSKHNVHADNLIFLDDIDLPTLTQNEVITLTATLVDHHVLSASEDCLREFVVEVLDHRPQDGDLPPSWRSEIERVGSCCTLVSRRMLASDNFELDATVSELLLGTILTDTGNMSPADNIGTQADHEVLVKLKSYLPPSISATSVYEEIRNSKFDLSSLTVHEMLQKDMKVLKGTHITVLMSSLTMPLEDVLVRPEFSQDATEFLTSFPADVLVIMTMWKDAEGASHRRIAVFSPSRVYREQITDVILHAASPNLDLQPLTSPAEVENISAFIQNNIQVSRKGVLPLIRDFLAGEMTSPDENLNALMDTSNPWGDPYQDSDKGDHSEEEARRHINIAKTFQSDQFRTSQDRYDLAAVGTDALISPSLSTDSELSSAGKRRGEEEDFENEGLGNIREEEREFDEAGKNTDDVDDLLSGGVGGNVSSSGGVGFVDNLIDFGMDESRNQGEGADFGDDLMTVPLGVKRDKSNEVIDLLSGMVDSQNHTSTSESSASLEPQSSLDLLAGLDFGASSLQPNTQTDASAHMQAELLADTQADILSSNLEEVDAELTPATTAAEATAPTKLSADDTGVGEDILVNHTPFDLLCPNNVDSPLELPSMPTSGAASGQGSKVPSYPDTPPNSYMEPSGIAYFKETQLPSFNSSEMVRRIHEKKAALAGHTAKRLATDNPDDEGESLSPWGAGSSGGGGSLISPAVPQNSFADLTQGFDFMSSSHQLPKLSNTDIVERVTEKRSQFEWSVESLEGSSSGVDVGHNGDEGGQKLHGGDGLQMGLVAGSDPQVPYTPTNSYVEASFDTYARSNLPSMNNAEVAAKIKAKQSAMFGSGSSSRVSRSSHGSDDSGGCHSPEVVGKGSRGASLDSPQVPYTPQNSYRDNLNMLEAGNRLPDLNEVAERLSIENSSKRKFGKGSASNSGGGSRDEENMNPGLNQPHQQQQQQQQQQQTRNGSDSQNTMSDVESLMSVSTDVGTPSDNVVASNIASQIRAEASPLSRKDTGDSDVFASGRSEDNIGAGEDGRQRDNQLNLQTRNAPSSQDQMDKNDDNGENKEEDVNYKASNGFAGTQELFSPVDSSQLQTLEDHAIFEAAEDIVARSVAAAVRVSQTEPQQRRSSGRLRWDDNVVQANCVNFEERQADYEVSEDEEEDAELLAEGLPDGGEDLDSDEDNQGSTYFSTENNIVSQNLAEEMAEHNNQTLASPAAGSQGQGYFNHLPESETQSSEVEQLSTSGTGQIQSSMESSGEQGISDQALNELAFELANELIQSALEDFPFHQGAAAASNGEDVEGDAGNNKKDIEREEMLGGQQNADRISTSSMEIPTIRDEGNGEEQGMSPGKFGDEQEETISTGRSPGKDRKSSGTLLDARKHSASSLDSNSSSSSSERKRSRDADSAMTIMEDEVKISFPERKPSSEFGTVEETEEEIQSFPGRKFSKSEDYPSRRFSRDDNSSRRSSRMEDSDIEVGIGPEGIETDYLPGMDPLQGNLDIIDGSFSKMTDSDREVVEGESFRKVSHHDKDEGGDGKEEEVDNEKVLEGYRRRLSGETYGLAAEREKEERELREKQSSIGDEQSAAVGRGGAESYEGKQNEDEALFDDRKADAEVAQVNKPTLKQKKKIRVSFSEDFDDEVGDFNIVSSTRSPLKSPPPPISLEHEATLSSSAPLFTDEVGGAAAAAVEETGAVYSEEWQDDEITEMARDSGIATDSSPPDPLRKKIVPDSAFAQGIADGDDLDDDEEEEDKNDDDNGSDIGDLEWENDTPVTMVARPGIEPTMAAESTAQASQRWKRVSVSGADFDIDLLAVEPYKSVLSHGGYYEEGLSAIIVFYGCHLPSRRQEDYTYIMNHLFHYVIHTLEELVADDYVIIYFHGSTPRRQMPGLGWLKRCYQSIDRRLKKNLKGLFLVHPTLWLRTVVTMIKPFISSKFSSKLRFVRSLEELNSLVPMDKVNIPDVIVHYDIYRHHLPTPPTTPQHRFTTSR